MVAVPKWTDFVNFMISFGKKKKKKFITFKIEAKNAMTKLPS